MIQVYTCPAVAAIASKAFALVNQASRMVKIEMHAVMIPSRYSRLDTKYSTQRGTMSRVKPKKTIVEYTNLSMRLSLKYRDPTDSRSSKLLWRWRRKGQRVGNLPHRSRNRRSGALDRTVMGTRSSTASKSSTSSLQIAPWLYFNHCRTFSNSSFAAGGRDFSCEYVAINSSVQAPNS